MFLQCSPRHESFLAPEAADRTELFDLRIHELLGLRIEGWVDDKAVDENGHLILDVLRLNRNVPGHTESNASRCVCLYSQIYGEVGQGNHLCFFLMAATSFSMI